MRLRINGCTFPIGQGGTYQVVLEQAAALPEGPAEVVLMVDGRERRWPVLISDREQVRRVVPIVLQPMIQDPAASA